MARPPLFSRPFFKEAAERIREGGPEEADSFVRDEPYLKEYMNSVIANAMTRLFENNQPTTEEEAAFAERVHSELQLTAVKVLMISRECFRDASVKVLEAQLEMQARGFDEGEDVA